MDPEKNQISNVNPSNWTSPNLTNISNNFNANQISGNYMLNAFTQNQIFIIERVYAMANPGQNTYSTNNANNPQILLFQQFDKSPQTFISSIFSILNKYLQKNAPPAVPIIKYSNINGNSLPLPYLLLLYLRQLPKKCQFRMQNYVQLLQNYWEALNSYSQNNSADKKIIDKYKQLCQQSIISFLCQPKHKIYLKQYIEQLTSKLFKSTQSSQLNLTYLQFINPIIKELSPGLGGEAIHYKPSISVFSEAMLKDIITNYAYPFPQLILQHIDAGGPLANQWVVAWIQLILNLCGFCRYVPNSDFVSNVNRMATVTDGLQENNQYEYNGIRLHWKYYWKMFQIMSRMEGKYGTVQNMYHLTKNLMLTFMQVIKFYSINRITTQLPPPQFISSMLKSLKCILKTAFSTIVQLQRLSQLSQCDISQTILCQYFKQYKLFHQVITNITDIMGILNEDQQSDAPYQVTQIMELYYQYLQMQSLVQYVYNIKDDIIYKGKRDVLFCFLAALPRQITQVFKTGEIIGEYIQYLLQNGKKGNYPTIPLPTNSKSHEHQTQPFFNLLLHYVLVTKYLDEQQRQLKAFLDLINEYIANLPIIATCSNKTDQTVQYFYYLHKSYAIALICHIEKYWYRNFVKQINFTQEKSSSQIKNEVDAKVSNILYTIYQLIQKLFAPTQQLQVPNKQHILQIAIDSLSQINQIDQQSAFERQRQQYEQRNRYSKQISARSSFQNFGLYRLALTEAVISFFQSKIPAPGPDKLTNYYEFLYLQFMKVLESSYLPQLQFQLISSMPSSLTRILKIFSNFFYHDNPSKSNIKNFSQYPSNKPLKDQITSIVMRIIFKANTLYANQKINKKLLQELMNQFLKTNVYGFILRNFLNEEEDDTYCKLLIQNLSTEKGANIVEQLLTHTVDTIRKMLPPLEGQAVLKLRHNYDKIFEALYILWDVKNQYTKLKGINQKIDAILGGNLENLFSGMSLEQKKEYDKKTVGNNNNQSSGVRRKKIHWSWLPENRNTIQPGSYVAVLIDKKLNENN